MTKRIEASMTVTSIIVAIALLAGCNGGNRITGADVVTAEATPIAFAEATATIADARAGTLITGNVGSTPIVVRVNGGNPETIAAGNETERALNVGLYLVTFETASGALLAGCTYSDLIINADASTGAYCAE